MATQEQEQQDGLFFRTEIRILQFWRNLLGEREFRKYDNDDLVRWYLALETAGPLDIREKLIERRASRPMSVMLGIVGAAPHPPTALIEQWLETEETKVHSSTLWYTVAVFLILTFMLGLIFSSCSLDYTVNPLALNPQPTAPELPNAPIAVAPTTGNQAFTNPTPQPPAAPSFPTMGGAPPPPLHAPSTPTTPAPYTSTAGHGTINSSSPPP